MGTSGNTAATMPACSAINLPCILACGLASHALAPVERYAAASAAAAAQEPHRLPIHQRRFREPSGVLFGRPHHHTEPGWPRAAAAITRVAVRRRHRSDIAKKWNLRPHGAPHAGVHRVSCIRIDGGQIDDSVCRVFI